jgi:hypothetical protein
LQFLRAFLIVLGLRSSGRFKGQIALQLLAVASHRTGKHLEKSGCQVVEEDPAPALLKAGPHEKYLYGIYPAKEALDNPAAPHDNANVIAGYGWVYARQAARIR